jgi:serine protease
MRKSFIFTSALLATIALSSVALADDPPPTNNSPSFVEPLVESGPQGDIALDLKDNLTDEEIAKFAADYDLIITNNPLSHDVGNLEEASLSFDYSPSFITDLIQRLSHDPRVEIAEPDYEAHTLFTPNDPQFKDQWNMERVNATSAWNYSCGQGTTVAVVDTGVACYDEGGFKKISDLQGTTCVPGANFVNPKVVPADDQAHGSHCAGTIAQTTNNGIGVAGLAYCTKIMPVKVLSSSGSGSFVAVAEGIKWAADHGAQVINLSLGSSHNSAIAARAVKYAQNRGVFVSCAAGNDKGPVGYPAANDGCFAISASDQKDNLAWFSSYGKQVKIAAPGVGILQQTISEGGKGEGVFSAFNGTSMAAPHVAGAAADVMAMGITDPHAVMDVLQSSAVEKSDHNKFGAGVLDAGSATRMAYLKHLVLRLGFLVGLTWLVGMFLKRDQKKFNGHPAKFVGALLTSVGMFAFLPFIGVLPHMGSFRWVGDILSRPVGEWDLILNVGVHKWLPLANALPVFGLVALGFHRPVLKSFAGGLALGTAALLGQMMISGDSYFVLGTWGLRLWCLLNGAALVWVSKGALGKSVYQ